MDNERLTPYLRRRCLALRPEDRVALVRSLQESLTPSPRTLDRERLEVMAGAMERLAGPFRSPKRLPEYVRARVVFAFTARQEGFSQIAVGRFLGLNHATIHYFERRMRDVFAVPTAWQDYINLYNQFTSAII